MNALQLDLFLDSREVTLANEVVATLCAHDSERGAEQSIAHLRAEAPARPDLEVFERLQEILQPFERFCRNAEAYDALEEAANGIFGHVCLSLAS